MLLTWPYFGPQLLSFLGVGTVLIAVFVFSTLSFLDGALFLLVPGGGWWFDARASMYGLCARRGTGAGESVFV